MSDHAYDIVIRGGTVIDGSGEEPFEADVAIKGGVIAAIGEVSGTGTEELDAKGRIVTPGFVDIHTHYDGQVTWENTLAPSSGHGVTTVIMGNCGVGFAPAHAEHREMLVKMMEGVEDIPEVVMAEGVPWKWETFPEYLDFLEQRHADIDFAAQLPHNPLRVYVMGERGAAYEPPTADDLAKMRDITAGAIRAGAIGVSTTLHTVHRYRDGRHVPSVMTQEEEVLAIAAGLADAGAGVFEILGDPRRDRAGQMQMLRHIAETSGRPVSFTLTQINEGEGDWIYMLKGLEEANRDGLEIKAQIMPRPVGILLGLELSVNPFAFNPSYKEIAQLPLAEKVARMRDPELRARILSEESDEPNPFFKGLADEVDWLFPLGNPPQYHPDKKTNIASLARAQGRDPREVLYDELLKDEGKALLYRPSANREGERFEGFGAVCIKHPHTLLGLGDGGAHYGMICDGAFSTYFLLHWVRHEEPEKRVSLPLAIKMLASDTARAVGLNDRGRLAVGFKADVNVIDLEKLHLYAPHPVFDLPAGGRRLIQEAAGYDATIVSGQVTYRDGKPTGALPGRLVRGAQQVPGGATTGALAETAN